MEIDDTKHQALLLALQAYPQLRDADALLAVAEKFYTYFAVQEAESQPPST